MAGSSPGPRAAIPVISDTGVDGTPTAACACAQHDHEAKGDVWSGPIGAHDELTQPYPTKRRRTTGIIAWIIIGLLAGATAKILMPGKDPGGIIVTMLIGIVGGLLGGWLGKVVFGVDSIDGFFDLSTWIAAIVGSLILLLLYRVVTGNRRLHRHA